MSAVVWHISIAGQAIGPLAQDQVAFLFEQGRLLPTDFVFGPGMKAWATIAETPAFMKAAPEIPEIPAPPPAPPPAAPKVSAEPAAPPAAAKAAKTPAPKAAPKAAPKPAAPAPRHWRVPIEAKVWINGEGPFRVVDISEGGLLAEVGDHPTEVGDEVKLKIESDVFEKTLDMNALVVRREAELPTKAFGIEFVRANPAYRRLIAAYVKSRMGEG